MIDNKFTEEVARWLQEDHSSNEKISEGAMLLLRTNRDTAMYQRIKSRPQRELKFLEYKLKRILQMRRDGQTIRDVVTLDRTITPVIARAVAADTVKDNVPVEDCSGAVVRKGIRPDHDKLPADIQAIWGKNAERWKKIKATYETCKQLTEPCDRYEHLKILKDTWYKYKKEMARYDDYVLSEETQEKSQLTPEQEKELSNADSYISRNLPQLLQLVSEAQKEEFNEAQQKQLESLRSRVQQRVIVLLQYGRTLTDERKKQLEGCDIKVTLDE